MRLHRAAQIIQNVGHALAGIRRLEPREARAGSLAASFGRLRCGLGCAWMSLIHLLARGLAEHQKVEQGVGAEAVGAVNETQEHSPAANSPARWPPWPASAPPPGPM